MYLNVAGCLIFYTDSKYNKECKLQWLDQRKTIRA